MYRQPTQAVNHGTEKLKDLVGSLRTCMFTEVQADGQLASKPMTLLELDDDGVPWFMTSLEFIQHADWPVNISFSDEGSNTYVSLSGTAQAVQDRERIHELWGLYARPFFPEGPDSPDVVLIKVLPHNVEYWDGPSNALTRSASMLASVVAGRPVGMGEHGFIKT